MKNSCKISFEGLNVNRLLTVLGKKGITIYGVIKQGKKYILEVPASRSRQTIALLKEKCYNILGIEFFGISKVVKFLKKHFVLPIFCLFAVIVIAVSSQLCFRIEVNGDFEQQIVCDALQDLGVKVGADLHKLNINRLQNALANKLDATYAVVRRSGSVLYVNVIAKKEIDPPIKLDVKRNIVATRSGTVVGVLCEQGTPLVKIGDSVKAGDVLIEGKRLFNDGTSEDVYALGRVTLEITSSGFAPFDGTKTVTVETGNTFNTTGVVLFGKEYAKTCPFAQYNVETVVTRLFPLNLEIRKECYRETVTQRVPAAIEECIEELKSEAYRSAFAIADFAVKDIKYDIQSDGVHVTLYGEVCLE